MGKFSSYDISLKSLADGKHTFNYLLEDDFFEKIDSPEVRKGTVNAKIVVSRNKEKIEIDFMVKGTIQIPCTRCLDDMTQAIDVKEKLYVTQFFAPPISGKPNSKRICWVSATLM